MSFISTSTIDDIAHSLDISKLSHEAAKALAPDAEYRMRELIQVCGTCSSIAHARQSCA